MPVYRSQLFPSKAVSYINAMPDFERRSFSEVFAGANPLGKSNFLFFIFCDINFSTEDWIYLLSFFQVVNGKGEISFVHVWAQLATS